MAALLLAAMSIFESEESPFQILRMTQTAVARVTAFSGKKEDFRLWENLLDEQVSSIGMSCYLRGAFLPACVVSGSPEGLKAFYSKLEKYSLAQRHIRFKVREALPPELQVAVYQLPPTKTTDFLSHVTLPEDQAIRDQIITRVTEYTDENKEKYVEKLPALHSIMVSLEGRFTATTAIEKNYLYHNFVTMTKGRSTFDQFISRMRDGRAVVVDTGIKIDDTAVINIILANIDAEAAAIVRTLMAQDRPLEELISILSRHYRDKQAGTGTKQKEIAQETTLDALSVFQSSPAPFAQTGGGRGRGGRRNRGGGDNRGGARGGGFEFRDGLPVCACCKGLGHKKAQCPSRSILAQAQPAQPAQSAQSSKKDLVCDFCKKKGHSAEDCYKRKKEEKKAGKPLTAFANVDAMLMSVMFDPHSHKKKLLFIIDSGAQQHICNDPDLFVSLYRLDPPKQVNGINPNEPLIAYFVGEISVILSVQGKPKRTTFSDVLFCPSCPVSLFSQTYESERGTDTETYHVDGDKPGKMIGKRDGQVYFEGEQIPGSARMLLKFWERGSDTQLAVYPVVSTCPHSNMNDECGDEKEKVCVSTSSTQPLTHSHIVHMTPEGAHAREQSGEWICNDSAVSPMMYDENLLEKSLLARNSIADAALYTQKVSSLTLDDDSEYAIDIASVGKNQTAVSERKKERAEAERAHVKIGHFGGRRTIMTMRALGLDYSFTEREAALASLNCEACAAGRAKRIPHPKVSMNRSTTPGAVWHYDTFGPTRHKSVGGAQYCGFLVDEASLHLYTFFAAHKNDLMPKVIDMLKQLRARGVCIAAVVTDNAAEFTLLWNFCAEVGIEVRKTVPGESAQNGLVERMIGVITEKWRCLRAASNAPFGMWAEGFSYARYLHNNTAHAGLDWQIPNKILFGKQIDISQLFPFGCAVWLTIVGGDKLADRAMECCFLGVDDMNNRKGWRVWDIAGKKVKVCWNMKFLENVFPWRRVEKGGGVISDDDLFPNPSNTTNSPQPPAPAPAAPQPPPVAPPPTQLATPVVPARAPPPGVPARDLNDNNSLQSPAPAPEHSPVAGPVLGDSTGVSHVGVNNEPAAVADAEPLVQPAQANAVAAPAAPVGDLVGGHSLRTTRGAPPTRYGNLYSYLAQNDDVKDSAALDLSNAVDEPLPISYSHAIKGKNAMFWKRAWEKELNALRKYGVFQEVDSLPPGKRCLKGKIVLAVKKDEHGKTVKFKARFVACGYDQKKYEDYFHTKSDVAETRSFRLVLCVGVRCGGSFFQGDVSSAFLQSELDEEIYLLSPHDYGLSRYVRLLRPLYGLVQSPRQWRTTFDTALRTCGLTNCEREPGVYYRLEQGRIACMLVVHVDDFFGWSVSKRMSDAFVKKLSTLHDITYTMDIRSFLGMDLTWGEGFVCLSQRTYIKIFLKTFDCESVLPKRLPVQKGTVIEPLSEQEKAESVAESEVHDFASRVGHLSYLGTHTRYDMCFIINSLARFMHHPCNRVTSLLPDVFAYVSYTKNCGIRYGGVWNDEAKLVGFCDASFPNSKQPYPQIGFIFFIIAGDSWSPISWCSRRLKHVCLSTEEAELAAASEAAREAIALRSILVETKLFPAARPVCLYVDNKSAVHSANDGGYFPKLKHVNIEHKFVMQACAEHNLHVEWVAGKENPADVLTKALSAAELDSVRKLVFVDVSKLG